jgi:dihydrofolate synthase / folylpolyglutamate synthase
MQFAEALRYLLSLGHETLAIKLGLRNISLLLESLGSPQQKFFSVQIAGTNGKGSTAVMLASICQAAGIRTGLFTSPHLTSITERIQIDGKEISEELFAECATRVRSAAEELVSESTIEAAPSFFEQVTATAFLAFIEGKVELAILETGLGGRLDATSVAGAQVVGITPIAMDHEEYLGKTISSIAKEKAAIIRPETTAVVAPQSAEVMHIILESAGSRGVVPSIDDVKTEVQGFTEDGCATATFTTPEDRYESTPLGLRGRHQITNAALAIRLAEALRQHRFKIPHAAIASGLESAKHPGRLEVISANPRVLLDGAHNPSGAAALKEYLGEFARGQITLVFGAMKDKRLDEMAEVLFPLANNLVLTEPQNPRAASVDQLEELARQIIPSVPVRKVSSVAEALKVAREVTSDNGLIAVAGSLYLIGEVKIALREKS